NCPGLVAADRPRVIPAAFDLAALNADQVRLTFIGHATFLIESPQLVLSETEPAIWDLKYRDVRVRNVPTNIRSFGGGTERYGNSIFVFEIANLCIAHLGHLHHTLTQAQLNEI